jgi:hypothetical protein
MLCIAVAHPRLCFRARVRCESARYRSDSVEFIVDSGRADPTVLSALVPASIVDGIEIEISSGGVQHTQNRGGAAKEVEPSVFGGDLLIGSGAGTDEVTQFVVGATEVSSRSGALEPTHRTVSAFDAAMILLQSVVEILAVAMPHTFAQRGPDRPLDSCRAHPW